MRKALAPILFDDHQPAVGEAVRESIVAPAQRSPEALAKALRKRTEEGFPVHSFRTLLADLRTIAKNTLAMEKTRLEITTTPTAFQQRVFDLLRVPLG